MSLALDVRRAMELIAEEASLRERARIRELMYPDDQEAVELFRAASDRRRERHELLDRCGLTR